VDVQQYLRTAYRYAAETSEDPVTWNGSLVVSEDGMVSYGTNRLPLGVQSLPERLERPAKYDYLIHAEQDSILQSALHGVSTFQAVMYCPWAPCTACARFIIQSGIRKLVAHKQMHDKTPERWVADIERALGLLKEAGVEYEQWDGVVGECEHKFNGEIWHP
jgi:dCMP deaminase